MLSGLFTLSSKKDRIRELCFHHILNIRSAFVFQTWNAIDYIVMKGDGGGCYDFGGGDDRFYPLEKKKAKTK